MGVSIKSFLSGLREPGGKGDSVSEPEEMEDTRRTRSSDQHETEAACPGSAEVCTRSSACILFMASSLVFLWDS